MKRGVVEALKKAKPRLKGDGESLIGGKQKLVENGFKLLGSLIFVESQWLSPRPKDVWWSAVSRGAQQGSL